MVANRVPFKILQDSGTLQPVIHCMYGLKIDCLHPHLSSFVLLFICFLDLSRARFLDNHPATHSLFVRKSLPLYDYQFLAYIRPLLLLNAMISFLVI